MSNGPNNSEISRSATALIDADTLQPIEAKTISTSHTSQEQQDLKMPVDDGPQPASTTADNKLHQRQSSHVQTSLRSVYWSYLNDIQVKVCLQWERPSERGTGKRRLRLAYQPYRGRGGVP
ncbi:hypothetical protein BDQ12DRAFT_253941 [Crucibulum laeve]|uniref:Uncharacterized protein n=1 Tax=Crucibulum laeve TaxID=68775 RepID=A0A5C3LUZ7_9AGAR|nr:hypothetical protein BDQ12DRAFT_253941 [Crucibulum laeve]